MSSSSHCTVKPKIYNLAELSPPPFRSEKSFRGICQFAASRQSVVVDISQVRSRLCFRDVKNQKAEQFKKAPRFNVTFCLCCWYDFFIYFFLILALMVFFVWIFPFWFHLPVSLPNSSNISSLPFDLGMLPTKRRRLGTLTFIFKHLPGLISKLSSCSVNVCGERRREK